jgi:hypothetical protein
MLKLTTLLVIILFIALSLFILDKIIQKQLAVLTPEFTVVVKKEELPERIGEKIIYDVRLGNINLGKAKFNQLPKTELNSRKLNLVTFDTQLSYFKDTEKIYSDPQTFLPLKVERNVSTWPKAEKITEEYDQENFTVTITKLKGKKKEQALFKRDNVIHNAVLLPFYVRRVARLELGWTLRVNLPTQNFEIKLIDMEDIRVPAGDFKSYHFQSNPSRFEIWISADERRIPLKIKGSGTIGYTLAMREYSILSDQ